MSVSISATIGHANPDEPALPVGIVVDGLRLVDGLLVDLQDLAREGRDDVGDGLHRLHLAVRDVLRDRRSDFRRLVVHELAEGILGEPRDPERRLVAAIRAQSCSVWYRRSSG